MSTLAIAVLLASLVAKGVLEPKRAGVIGAIAFALAQLAFQEHPIPILLSAPLCFASLWGTFLLIERATIKLLPVAIVSVMFAVGVTEGARNWLITTLHMPDARTQARLDDYHRQYPDAGTEDTAKTP